MLLRLGGGECVGGGGGFLDGVWKMLATGVVVAGLGASE